MINKSTQNKDPENYLLENASKIVGTLKVKFMDHDAPICCKLHHALTTCNCDHNCLGCNFADMIRYIIQNLSEHSRFETKRNTFVNFYMTNYFMTLGFARERIQDLLKLIIALNDGQFKTKFELFSDEKKENNQFVINDKNRTSHQISCWYNFHKHPNDFFLVHHPEYTFENIFEKSNYDSTLICNDTTKSIKKTLESIVTSTTTKNNKFIVVYPDIMRSTIEFADIFNEIINTICNDTDLHKYLSNETTFSGYHC